MAFDVINVGTSVNDGTGDTLRAGGVKINANFAKAVEGPASSTDNSVAVFDGAGGKLLKDGTGTVSAGKFAPTANTVTGNGMFLPAADTLAFSTAGAERFRIGSTGNVVIGNGDTAASPAAATLRGTNASGTDVAGPNMTIQAGRGTGTGAGGSISFQTSAAGSSGSTLNAASTRLFIGADGNVGIGTASPDTRFHVDGTIRYTNRPAAGTITAMGWDTNGDLKALASSARYKFDVETYGKGLDVVNALRPVSFKYLTEERENIGFIAEEVDELGLHEVMLYDDAGRPEGVLYGNMVALLTKAVQELSAQVVALQGQVAGLSGAAD